MGVRYRYRQKCKRKKAYQKRRKTRLREAVAALSKKK